MPWHAPQQYARRQLVLEPWRSSLSAAYASTVRQGQRTAALANIKVVARYSALNWGRALPEAETTTLYEQIRSGEFDKGIRRQPLSGRNKATSDRATSDRGPAHPAGDSLLPPHGTRAGAIPAPLVDWGEMPAGQFFAGRAVEVEQLQRWLTPGNPLGAGSGPPARLIAVSGSGRHGEDHPGCHSHQSRGPAL